MNSLHPKVFASHSRRTFLIRASSLLATPALFHIGRSAWADAVETGKTATVNTTYGQLRGVGENGVFVFKGIPYTGPSEGPNRFQPPTKLAPWSGVRDALEYGPQAYQQKNPNGANNVPSSENCQFINIWTPAVGKDGKKPVMYYLHGSGFIGGSGGSGKNLLHDGSALSRNNDAVVVTSNHRLGVLGYLWLGDLSKKYPASGIAGMLDIAASLQWIHDNIASFGGDPDNVFIFGESGGGQKVETAMGLPAAHGLFHKASIESAPSLHLNYREIGTKTTLEVMKELGLKPSQVDDLVNIPPERLMEAQGVVRARSEDMEGTLGYFGPVVDGHYLPAHPYDPVGPAMSKNVSVIIGSNKQEGLLRLVEEPETFKIDEAGLKAHIVERLGDKDGNEMYQLYRKNRPNVAPFDVYVDFLTHQWMWVDTTRRSDRQLALHGAPVYSYIFDYESEVPLSAEISYPRKAIHGMEVAFKFGHPENDPATGKRPERIQAGENMSRAWAAFARTGDPSHNGIPKWPSYTSEQRATMILNATCQVVTDPMRDERLAWLKIPDKIGPKPHHQGVAAG